MGDLEAMTLASSTASCMSASREGQMRETRPKGKASEAERFRPENTSSRTRDWLPTSLGKRCRPPTSAASPTSTSFKPKTASAEQNRISAAAMSSTPAPMHAPWTQAMTTLPHFSRFVKASCQCFPTDRIFSAVCPMSPSGAPTAVKASMSTPEQNNLPSPVKSTTRMEPSVEMAPKKSRISSHILRLKALRLSGRCRRHSTTPGAIAEIFKVSH
mmetsp:Transcript_70359/g.228721  ORF Transcript_70359/g.228721 Transcript_70359/m.228721 type:complete len:215 (-) Transcript_70359:79-723(-)